ncbi:hypothetical protein KR200_011781, partial [Drosophila serrata]
VFLVNNIKLLAHNAMAACNECQSESNVACHSETTFSVCYDGVPTYKLLPCPDGFYCTDGFYTCYRGASPVCESTTTTPPTTTTTTEAPWNAEDLCNAATKSTFFENKDDPTCTTYISCSVSNTGVHSVKITTCKENLYFDASLKICGPTKPDGCLEAETTTTTTTTSTTTTTTTALPWSKEATCADITVTTLFTNEDDPTCTTYVYCYISSGVIKALIKSCKANQYFDSSERVCVSTKPDYCT